VVYLSEAPVGELEVIEEVKPAGTELELLPIFVK
jgi:hypothetical protein